MHWRRHGPREGEPDHGMRPLSRESNVGDECEAFVAGHYTEYLMGRGEEVPAWSWLNRVSHADPSELQALADSGRAPADSGRLVDWDGVSARLAAEVLALAPVAVGGLRELQLRTLIPLELALARSHLRPQLTAGQFYSLVVAAMSTHPTDAQKPT